MTDRSATLRAKLLDMRSQLIGNLDSQISAGDLSLIAGVNAALVALDAEAQQQPLDEAGKAERVVVVGCDDEIKVVSYTGSTTVSAVTITSRRAVAIALDLLDLASRRWPT